MSITQTRQALIDVARKLFAQKGLEATTMNDIAQESGRGRRTLYTYFRNKEEIYFAVIEEEMNRLSEKLDDIASMDAEPEEKLFQFIYTHLRLVRDTVARNGSLRAEFFRNIWMVERVRRKFDEEEHHLLLRILEEGVRKKKFFVEQVALLTDIIHCSVKGLEVPYIYDRLGEGLTEEETYPVVKEILRRVLGMPSQLSY